jgi:hypothetical protein
MIFIDLVLLGVVFSMMLYRPSSYDPIAAEEENGLLSPYLTHYLATQVYNGLETSEPFEVVVEQTGVNDIIARANWPMESEGIFLSDPVVVFEPNEMILMGLADFRGINFVVTIVIKPIMDANGLLYLSIDKLRVGAMNLALIARPIARKMYHMRAAELGYDPNKGDFGSKIAGALLAGEAFEPVISLNGKKARIYRVSIAHGKAILGFRPVDRFSK